MPNNWTPEYRRQQNAAKQDAIRILMAKRAQMTINGTAARILWNAIDHLMVPEEWS